MTQTSPETFYPEQRTWAEISRSALEHNLRALRNIVPTSTKIMPAIKAQAYGHGASLVAPLLAENGISHVAVANLKEAKEIASHFPPQNILLLSAPLMSELQGVVESGFATVISQEHEIERLEKLAQKLSQRPPVHLKIDTGMGRLGCAPALAHHLVTRIISGHRLELAGVMTHFASADISSRETRRQLDLFLSTIQRLHLPRDCPLHAANSAGLLSLPESRLDFVRPGISLYGVAPIRRFQKFFRPVLTWKARVTLVKDIPAGHGVSYAGTYRASMPMRIAVVSVGYADGYPRAISNKGHVLLRGRKCAVLGRVTMDEIMVDVTRVPSPSVNEEVILLGGGLPPTALAKWADTSPYEILTRIGLRVPRVLVD